MVMLSVMTVAGNAATKTVKHTVKKGDTLYSLALKNHTTVAAIKKANGIKKGQALKLGKVLKVPVKATKATASKKKKRVHVASSRSNRQEKQLAKTLKSVKFKKANSKKSNKFSMSDILFSGKGSKKSMKMIKLAKNKLGRRYVWGAVGQKNTFDCSGLTSYVCKKNGIKIPRRAIEQSKYGKYVSRSNLKPGDLIFFDTSKRRKGYVNHVGIYIGNNKFIHASSAKHKVIITSLSKNFYSKRYKGARRVTS
jgi:cell wall-associated NlpC family hydrolase